MILDITRHKFSEAIATLLLFVIAATVAVATLYYAPRSEVLSGDYAPLGELLFSFRVAHPVWSISLFALLYLYAVLRLSRATVRVALYPQGTLAAISLCAVALFGVVVSSDYPLLIIVALLVSEAFGRLLYCFGPAVRPHYLFTAMLALGTMPLVDSALLPLCVVIAIAVVLMRLTLRETAITLVGSLLPTFVYCYVMWLMHNSFSDTLMSVWNLSYVAVESVGDYFTPTRIIFLGIMLFLQLATTLLYFTSSVTVTRATRDMWRVLMVAFVVLVATLFVVRMPLPSVVVAIALLVAVMLPMLFVRAGSLQTLVIYLLLLLSSLSVVISF